MSLLKCPRCGVMVEVSASASPQCATCNFPGPDTRPAPGTPATPPPAPPTHAASGRRARPIGVAILAILGFVGGGVLAASGALAAIAGTSLFADQSNRLFGVLCLFVGPTLAFVGALHIVVALGLWRGRSWAWTLQVILLALQALSAGSGLTHAVALPGLALTGLLGWYLFTPGVKAYFGRIEVAA